ncbi:MAG: acyltransferase [Rhodospirillales bacterium]|nr:acyltransferase [Rhodospirillales bacterium]
MEGWPIARLTMHPLPARSCRRGQSTLTERSTICGMVGRCSAPGRNRVTLAPDPVVAMLSLRRDTTFDAIRGYAALSVVVHHLLITWPDELRMTLHTLLYYTPLEALFSGGKAVRLFFVLSGFFLYAIVARAHDPDWRAFYAGRFIRLYPAFAVAVLLSAAVHVLVGDTEIAIASAWFNGAAQAPDVSVGNVLGLLLFTGTADSTRVDCVTWSLVMEVRFLALFPLLWIAVQRWDIATCLVVTLAAIAGDQLYVAAGETAYHITAETWLGAVGGTLHFLPAFVFGMVVCKRFDTLHDLVLRLPRWQKIALLVVGLIVARRSQEYVGALGVCILLVVCLQSEALRRLARRPIVERIGRGSYSIYLLHMPVLLLSLYLLQDHLPIEPILVIAFVATLAAAWLLHRTVVLPVLALAKAQRRAVGAMCGQT